MAGYALSMLLLAIASLVAIPAMIRASGSVAWGSVALGQAVGALSAVAIAYGWSMSGPARVARSSATLRLAEFRASVKVRLSLLIPMALLAAGVAAIMAPARRDLAALGAVTFALVGLTSNWFFVGLARPYILLLVETVPRVTGTAVGVVAMNLGQDALVGLLCQAAGFVLAFVCSATWVRAHLGSAGARPTDEERLVDLLRHRGDGLAVSMGTAAYIASPLMIVTAVAPASQPIFALLDKVARQISVALGPTVTVLQGWVPRARDPRRRARWALGTGMLMAVALSVAVLTVTPALFEWLGAGSVQPSPTARVIVAAFVGVNFLESLVSKSILATFDRLGDAARATLVGALIGLPLVPVGALVAGADGALAAVLAGLVARLVWELFLVGRLLRGDTECPSGEAVP